MATAQPAKAGDEFKLILPLLRTPLKQGDTWYPVGRKWWQSWCDYVGVDPEFLSSDRDPDVKASAGDKPKGIDTKALKADGVDHPELSKTVQEHTDFEWVPAAAYDLFTAWYGLSAGSLSFPRKVITVGLQQLERIDMYPSFLTLLFTDKTGEPDSASKRVEAVSGNTPLNSLLDKYAPKKEKDGKEDPNNKREGRVWIREKAKKDKDGKDSKDAKQLGWKLLEAGETKQKIETYEFAPLAEVMLEYQNAEGKFVRPEPVKKNWREFEIGDVLDAKDTQGKWYQSEVKFIRDKDIQVHFIGWPSNWDEWIPKDSQDRLAPKYTHCQEAYQSKSNSMGDMFTRQNSMGAPIIRGAVGLRNLGNTCFMNSTLQCLSNTPGLTDYFMENKHLGEINRDNALGWGGKVAEAYGELLHEIWGGQYSTVAPRNFKQVIGEFQPRFSGYQQHDSSELLSFLMDGLHEDLNRVKKKPPTQAVDSKGRPDAVVAKESWDRHLLRNKSVIVDQCQGQLKSRVVCPDCKKDSITFDPFMFLSVPLPQVTDRIQEVIYISSRPGTGDNTPKTYGIKVNKSAAVSDIKAGLAALLGTSKPGAMLVCEVWSNRLFKVFPHDSPVNRIQAKDEIWVYEVPELAENAASDQKDQKDPNEKPQENYISLQVTNQAIDKAKKKGTARMAGWPFVVAVPESKIKAMPVVELRKILHDAVTPFLKGGWQQGETDESLYSIHLMDKSGHEHIMDIPMKDDQKVDLTTQTGRAGFSFCLLWDEAQMAKRYWDGKTAKDKSAGDEDSGKKGLSVYDCMQAFTTQEVLRPGDEWYCPDCKKHQCATKKFDLWHLPDVLVVHLKRFNYNRMWRDKLDNLVDFPIEGLNLYDYVVNPEEKKNAVYDLYAVSNHFGGLGGGHYTAYAKNLIDKKWYNLDDSSVSPVQPSTVVTSAAYVLFYIRRGAQKGQSAGTKGTSATKGA